jgi:hypothetical protein
LGDSLRRVSVSGESADKVDALSKLLEKDFRRYATAAGGLKFRRVLDMPFDVLFNIAYDQQRVLLEHSKPHRVGDSDLFRVGFLLVLLVPWNRFLPALCFISAIRPFFSSGMRLKSFSYVLSRLSWEFHYPIFLYESSGSDFACIFCVGRTATWSGNLATD